MVQVHVLLSAEQRAWVVDQAQARAIGSARYIRVLMEEARGGPSRTWTGSHRCRSSAQAPV